MILMNQRLGIMSHYVVLMHSYTVVLGFLDYSLYYLHKLLCNPNVPEYNFLIFVSFSIFKYINIFIHLIIYSTNVTECLFGIKQDAKY